jgi:aryl-phospho-beta-D-glucosidase BglC (GH1 family)
MMAKLLIETSAQVETLVENTKEGGKQLNSEGICAQADVKNGNGRIYPKPIMEKAVQEYVTEYVQKRRALGELNHPDRPYPDPAEGAILIESLSWQGNNVVGKAKVLNTPKGLIVKGLLEGGFNMGVSTRGLGSLIDNNGIKVVQDDLQYTAVDCVDNPSAPNAYVNPLMESMNWIQKDGIWMLAEQEEKTQFNEQLFLEKLESMLKKIR